MLQGLGEVGFGENKGKASANVEALIIRIGFWGFLFCF